MTTYGTLQIGATGVTLNGSLSHNDWLAAISGITQMQKATPWVLGDLLILADQRLDEAFVVQHLECSDGDYTRYQTYRRVCEEFPQQYRNIPVSFSAYHAVARKGIPHRVRMDMLQQVHDACGGTRMARDLANEYLGTTKEPKIRTLSDALEHFDRVVEDVVRRWPENHRDILCSKCRQLLSDVEGLQNGSEGPAKECHGW